MKRNLLSVLLFVITFTVIYICLCYCIPEWRIKLVAEPHIYFFESLKHLLPIKAGISFVIGITASVIPIFIRKRWGTKNPDGMDINK